MLTGVELSPAAFHATITFGAHLLLTTSFAVCHTSLSSCFYRPQIEATTQLNKKKRSSTWQ
jgi:outer membrane protein assembly factor BamE (lipoprotein component of BamABCDE complex)